MNSTWSLSKSAIKSNVSLLESSILESSKNDSVNNPIVLPIYNKRMLVSLTGMTPKTPTSVMQKKLQSLPLWLDKLLIDGHPRIVGDTSDGNGYHVRIINFKVYIKTT